MLLSGWREPRELAAPLSRLVVALSGRRAVSTAQHAILALRALAGAQRKIGETATGKRSAAATVLWSHPLTAPMLSLQQSGVAASNQ